MNQSLLAKGVEVLMTDVHRHVMLEWHPSFCETMRPLHTMTAGALNLTLDDQASRVQDTPCLSKVLRVSITMRTSWLSSILRHLGNALDGISAPVVTAYPLVSSPTARTKTASTLDSGKNRTGRSIQEWRRHFSTRGQLPSTILMLCRAVFCGTRHGSVHNALHNKQCENAYHQEATSVKCLEAAMDYLVLKA